MRKLSKEVASVMIHEQGTDVFLARISDPFWFQAFGCVLGYDWHSSGVTTVVTGVLKQALSREEHGIAVCGGKGKTSKKTPQEIAEVGEKFGFSDQQINRMVYTSKITAKVDNSAIQAGYHLYHHAFFVAENKKWAVVQQGMDPQDRTARRYHWLADKTSDFVVEPHNAIVGDVKRESALNMTAKTSEGSRKASVDLAKENPKKTMRFFEEAKLTKQKSLQAWLPTSNQHTLPVKPHVDILNMPRTINWETMDRLYEFQPKNYEELLSIKGVGPATVRALALVSELIYGEKPSWEDPVKFCYTVGGKDRVPYPVNRESYDEIIGIMIETVQQAKIGDKEKMDSLKRLRRLLPENANT
jgi:hypothetical protein